MAKKTVEEVDQNIKNFLQSKTIWGVIIAFLPVLSNLVGFDIGIEVSESYGEIITIIGSILALYGRWKANGKIVAGKIKKK